MLKTVWIDVAVSLTKARMPHVSVAVAQAIAEELYESWPGLTPNEAISAYWDEPLLKA